MQTLRTAPIPESPLWPGRNGETHPPDDLGVASVSQLVDAGFTRAQIDALTRRRAIVQVYEGVYRTAATVLTPRRRLLAGCLAVGGVVGASDRAALWLWDLSDAEPPTEVTTTLLRRPAPDGVVVHVRGDLDPTQVSVRRGVPVTSPARTLSDAGAVVSRATRAIAVDKALYLRLVTLSQLRSLVGAAGGRANGGLAALDAVLGHRVHGF